MSLDYGIAVLHLVRAGNPTGALSAFLDSYRRHPAGEPHRLVMIFKGFNDGVPSEIETLLSDVIHNRIFCPDVGFDIGSYAYGIERISEPLIMLTNSFTEFTSYDWLAKLLAAINLPGMGAVGATGSWESLSGRFLREPMDTERPWLKRIVRKVKSFIFGAGLLVLFPDFPNIHLRTNALLIRRRDFLEHRPRLIYYKLQAWLFESGRRSLSRNLITRGLRLAVVGRDGTVYEPEEWNCSGTFWQGDQSNLLALDNQTRRYVDGDESFKRKKRLVAWAC